MPRGKIKCTSRAAKPLFALPGRFGRKEKKIWVVGEEVLERLQGPPEIPGFVDSHLRTTALA